MSIVLGKKTTILGLVAILIMVFVNNAPAQSSYSSDLTIQINQEQIIIPAGDQPPIIINDRTYVPLRIISENMGAKVDWIEDSRQVIILWKKQTVDVWPDSQGEDVQIIIDGEVLKISSELGKAFISEKGRTMIPMRAVGEAMDCKVDWIDETRTVDIKYTPTIIDVEPRQEEMPTTTLDPKEEDPLPGNAEPKEVEAQKAEEAARNLQLLKDLAVHRTNLKMLDGKVINSEDLLKRQPTEFSAEQLEIFRTYLKELNKYSTVIKLPDGSTQNNADIKILGDAYLSAGQLKRWIESETPRLIANARDKGFVFNPIPDLAELYISIGKEYGVRGDIAFCQAAKETGYWQFTGLVDPDQNNYCGLWATGAALTGQESLNGADPQQMIFEAGRHGATFITPAAGVEAHIQHLYAYATKEPLPPGKVLVDPRFSLVNKGIAPVWLQLNARWAVPGTTYGQSILADYWLKAANK